VIFRWIFLAVVLGLIGYIVWTVCSQYRLTTGTHFQRALAGARNSATILWTKFVAVVALVTMQLDNLADLLGAPEAKDFINQWVGNPKIIAAIMLAIASVTFYARVRPGSQSPLPPPPAGS
jgi:cellobiose-specific phosphotransferase system component IIC